MTSTTVNLTIIDTSVYDESDSALALTDYRGVRIGRRSVALVDYVLTRWTILRVVFVLSFLLALLQAHLKLSVGRVKIPFQPLSIDH